KMRFAFVVDAARSHAIYVTEGSEPSRPIYISPGDDGQELSSLAFSPSGSLLAFTRGDGQNPASDTRGTKAEIWIVEVDQHGEPRRIADGHDPAFIDGKSIWYVADGKLKNTTIDGAKTSVIQTRGEVTAFSVSPAAAKIAFVSARGDHAFIGVLDVASGGIV